MSTPRSLRHASPWFVAVGSFGLCRIRYRSILLTALTLSLLIASVVTFVNDKVYDVHDALTHSVDISSDEFSTMVDEALTFRTEEALKTFIETLGSMSFSFHGPVTRNNIVLVYILRIAPYAFFLAGFELLLLFITFTYFLVFFLSPSASEIEAILRLPSAVVNLFLLLLWAFLRSMVWIPFIGPLVALYLLPHFSLAPVLLLRGGYSVSGALRHSIHRTQGQWFSAVLSFLLLVFICFFLFSFTVVMASIPTIFSAKIGYLVFLVGVQSIVAYVSAFVLVYSELNI